MIRTLRPDEPIPAGQPKRYTNAVGYIRLRWLVGPDQYVEEYEHRIAAGRPAAHLEVHHIDGVKTNNDPSNLLVLTKVAHAELHGQQNRALNPPRSQFGGYRCRRDQERAKRKQQRADLVAWIRDRKADGMTNAEIGELIGLHNSGVSRLASQGHQ